MKFILTLLLTISIVENISAQTLLIPFRKDSLWGYANESGKIVVEPKYSNTKLFYKSKFSFLENKTDANKVIYGIINSNGNVIVEPKYSNIILLKDLDFNYNL